jgi:hypothetical protein
LFSWVFHEITDHNIFNEDMMSFDKEYVRKKVKHTKMIKDDINGGNFKPGG